MKRMIACLFTALLFVNLTACANAELDFPGGGESDPYITDAEKTELPTAPEETPEEQPEESTEDIPESLTPAPAYAIYPEDGALDELPEDGSYTSKEDVALYIYGYGHLPDNFITKKEARELGWSGGGLDSYAEGMCIGGDRFGNYEGLLPDVEGRTYYECDIDTLHANSRGAKRLVFCYENGEDNRQVYYTEDHYESFEMVYGDDNPNAYD